MAVATLNWLRGLWGMARSSAMAVARTGGRGHVPWETVYVAANRTEAEIVRGRLESEGIPVVLRGEALGNIYGLTAGPLAEVDVMVPTTLAEQAKDLLELADGRDDIGH